MLEQLKNKIINDSSLELTPFQIDYLVKELDKINVWFEVARNEVETAIEDIANDEYYGEYQQKLNKLTDEDINRIAWSVYDDEYSWESVYDVAKSRIYDEIGV